MSGVQGAPFPELRTERLVMRGWRDEDYEPFARIVADPDVTRGLGRERGMNAHEAWVDLAALAGHWALKGFGHWALELGASGELIGRAGLYHPPDWPELEVGWLVAREQWGRGFALEAARAACRWAHDQLGARHLISLIHPSNAQSQRVAEKLGERPEGRVGLRGFDLLVYGTDLPLDLPA